MTISFMSRRRLVGVAGALVMAIGSMAAVASTASAASCSGNGCNGLDPVATGCSNGSYTVLSGRYAGGLLELRWGPDCQTNWARFTPADNATYSIWVTRLSDGEWAGDGLEHVYTFSNGSGVAHYSDQIYSPGPASACVQSPQHGGQYCLRQSS